MWLFLALKRLSKIKVALLKISKNFNIHDLSNLPKVNLLVTVHIIFVSSFQNKVFSINTSFLLYNSAVYSLHSIVLSLTFMPSCFEAHGSLSSKFSLFLSRVNQLKVTLQIISIKMI